MIDDGILIEAVRSRRELYDKSHPGFKNAAIKDAGWASVSEIVGAPTTDCSARWHTLRERYNKEKRRLELVSRSGAAGGSAVNSVWCLYEAMKFLEPYIRKRKGVDNLAPATTVPATTTVADMFNEQGHFMVYSDGPANEGEELEQSGDGPAIDAIDGEASSATEEITPLSSRSTTPQPSSSGTPQPRSATPQPRPATPLPRSVTPLARSATTQATSSQSNLPGRTVPAGAGSLPYFGPTSRSRKRKSDDEATAFLKQTLNTLSKSLVNNNSQETVPSLQQPSLDPDSCIARNMESSLRNLPASLKLMYRRKFRELLQECEEATFNFQQEQVNNST